MKNIRLLIVGFILPFLSFAQTSIQEFKIDHQQLVIQGLEEAYSLTAHIYPTQVKTIEIEKGKKLEYVEKGDAFGTPVIFLHGITDSWHSFEKVLPLLPEEYHAFALSQRGHGNSNKNFDSYSPKDFANDVARFVTTLDLGPVIIVGHSMGGVVAQQFAIDHPELLKGLVIVDSDAAFKDNPGLPEFYAEVLKLKDPVSKTFMDDFQKATLAKPIEQSFFDTLVAESLKVPARVFGLAFKGIIEAEISKSIHKINAPTLLLWGDKDSFCLLTDQQTMQTEIKRSRLIIYEGTGHALHWEEPQRFVKDLNEFFKSIR